MRHLIAILLQNEAGALTRVTGLISSRGYNIESLSVAPTNDPTVSRVTLVTIGSDHVIAQIAQWSAQQSEKHQAMGFRQGELSRVFSVRSSKPPMRITS